MLLLSWNILTFLVIELLIKIKRPLSTNYKLRLKIYTGLTIIISAVELGIMGLVGSFGLASLGTCFLKEGSDSYWVAMTVMFINTPIILISLLALKNTECYKNNKALKKTMLTCISMVITWGVPEIIAGTETLFHHNIIILNYIGFFIACSSGVLLATARIGSKEIFLRLIKSLKKKGKEKSLKEILIEQSSVNNTFNNITQYTIKNLLLLLSLAFVTCQATDENYSYGYKKNKFIFSVDCYAKLSNLIDLNLFRLEKNGIWEYEVEYFIKIRRSCNITTDDLISSVCSELNLNKLKNFNSSGKSGAFIFITYNEKFVIKTITRNERYFLLNILPAYTKHIAKHPNSKLVRILGLFKVLNTKQSFIIMENIINHIENTIIFDLKGSLKNRYTPIFPNTNPVLKDQNIVNMEKSILLSARNSEILIDNLKSDTNFLKKFNIIDYSLLAAFYPSDDHISNRYFIKGLENTSYSLGIIDFLQEYTLFKKFEVLVKKIRGYKDFSICHPNKYSSRFLTFIVKLISVSNI